MNDSGIYGDWFEETPEEMEQRYLRYRRDLIEGEWRDFEASKGNSNPAPVVSLTCTSGNSIEQDKKPA